jgi:hypothetical protein
VKSRDQKRAEAVERQAVRNERTLREQLDRLDVRLGVNVGASSERTSAKRTGAQGGKVAP